jgi:pyruvate-formate lyase-activating enzyme
MISLSGLGGCIKSISRPGMKKFITLSVESQSADEAEFNGLLVVGKGVSHILISTLLVPGYIDEEEVRQISSWIASLDPTIPYALLAFYPQFFFNDLPVTSKEFALRCKGIAEAEGLERVRTGNLHLLQ